MEILLLPQPKILLKTVKSICGDAILTELFKENSFLPKDLVYASVNKRANRNTNAAKWTWGSEKDRGKYYRAKR